MKVNALSREEVLRTLVTSEVGLTEEEAGRRLREFGPNEIREERRTPLVVKFIRQFTHFLAILLWIGAGLALLSEYLHPGEGMLTLGLAIIGVIVINAIFTFVQEYRAEKSIEALRRLLPFQVKVIRDGKERELPARDLVPGDVIRFAEGDRVPADARLIASASLTVNNAPLTGESDPVLLREDAAPGELIESRNIAFAGTTVVSGSGKAAVFATGMRTEFGIIARLTGTVEPGLSPLQKEIVKVTRLIAAIATIMGVIFFGIGHFIGLDFWGNFIFAIGIIVANVPEGLLPTVTLALAMGSQRMARKKALIKTLTSVETLGSVTVICTDKTGTLTQNRMEVRRLWYDGETFTLDAASGSLSSEGGEGQGERFDPLLRVAALCNNARFHEGEYRGDPTETALLKMTLQARGAFHAERIGEIPFDSERKRMTTITREDGKVLALTKGAMESLLPLCSHLWLHGEKVPLDESLRARVTDACLEFMDRGLRVLAFAFRELDNPPHPFGLQQAQPQGGPGPLPFSGERDPSIEKDLIFAGLIGLEDPPRPEVPEALRKCRSAGIRVIMITGDGGRTALAIGKEIGLVTGDAAVIEGPEFGRMTDRELLEKLGEKEILFARMTPKHKMRVVSVLKDEGERVAVTGDGVNDAPALKKADIGIAMGIAGTDVAKEAADLILLDDNFATIVNAVEEGRGVYENIRKFISYIFASNIPEIVPYLAFVLFRIPLPLTILQILAVDLGTDMVPALALGAEKPTRELMKQPPRNPKERLLNRKILLRAYLFLGPIEAAAGLFGFFYVLKGGGWTWGEMPSTADPLYMQATTACLTAIVIAQVANVFACRSFNLSVFRVGFFSNRLIFVGIVVELLLQLFIVYHPWGNEIFATAPLTVDVWLILIPFAVVLFAAEEIRKKAAAAFGRTR